MRGKRGAQSHCKAPTHLAVKEISNPKEGAFLGSWFPMPGSLTVP